MSEFKISRFKYTWRGNWSTTTQYNRDDVVKYGGSSWVCRRQHTSGTFATDQIFVPQGETELSPAWIKMSDGYAWRDQWQASTLYNPGDVILYSGVLYLTTVSHTSSGVFDNDLSNFTVYGSQIAWTADWQTNTRYGIGDVVKYGGKVYRCIQGHQSSGIEPGLENNIDDWEILYEAIEYRGDWATGTRYRDNDLVKFGGTLFRCKKPHTPGSDSTLNFDQDEFWEIELPGFQPSGVWNETTVYQVGDVVHHGGYVFYSITNNYGSRPTSSIYQVIDRDDPPDWQIVSKAVKFRGDYDRSQTYQVGDMVRRGGDLYVCLLDTAITADESTLNYLDSSNWEILTVGQRFRADWKIDTEYVVNDIVVFIGNTYKCNFTHVSDNENFPGDNGSGIFYWDVLIQAAGQDVGMRERGDLLTFNLSRELAGDGSTFGPTRVKIVDLPGQLLTINDQDTVIYKDYAHINRVRYVALDGIDDETDPQRGISPFKPWRTVRFAAEQVDDDFEGTTTIRVAAGDYTEILPIIVPARVAVVGTELRTTTIKPNDPIQSLSNDSFYTNAVLTRISQLIQAVIAGTPLDPPKTPTNPLDPTILSVEAQVSRDPPEFDPITFQEILDTVEQPITTDPQAALDIQALIEDIKSYIDFYINSTGSDPVLIGTNTAVTDLGYLNAVAVLEANKDFFESEAVAFMQATYPSYDFDSDLCRRDVRRYIDAWKYDIIYTGNYKSLLAARYYRNAVLGSRLEDMFYLRDSTGLRNLTTSGLRGVLNPANVFDLYRLPTGGSFVSLDPGWGPADERTWIINRSPYVQGVTTFGVGCVGQKIDGSLHDGGNKSIVSNDFTQVISDGIGAWVTNQGRAELVSVFTYYAHVGYLASEGGIIRATNGNCSYGRFGAIADGNDPSEVPRSGSVDNRTTQATAIAFAGDFTDTIQILEWNHAGEGYSQASASFVGAGVGASVLFEDFRDDAVFESRVLDSITDPENIVQNIGGGGYTRIQNNAQVHQTPNGDLTSITIAALDPNIEDDYLGMRILITGGPGTGQYAYITGYNVGTKVVTVSRESDDQPGWDHVIPGTPVTVPLTGATSYRIEPRPIFSHPGYDAVETPVGILTNWGSIVYGETTETYNNILTQPGTGIVEGQDGLLAITARFNVIKQGRSYVVSVNNPGAGYERSQVLTITGNLLGGTTPRNDLTIKVIEVSNDSTNSIVAFETSGTGASGKFLAITEGGTAGLYSSDGETWPDGFTMPSSGDWTCLAAGNNRFVAIRTGSAAAASSLNGINWTARTMPANRQWSAVTYGGDRFVAIAKDLNSAAYSLNGTTWTAATMPTVGDSTLNEWVDITYGKGIFLAVANSQNIAAYSTDGIAWNGVVMDSVLDSSQKDWVSVAYGNNRFVAISSQGDVSWSFDGEDWRAGSLPAAPGSGQMTWKKIRYAQGVFFAVCEAEGGGATNFAVTSQDGILWTPRTLASSLTWKSLAFGNPYIEFFDSSVGKNTPMWVAIAGNTSDFNKITTGARALGRAEVIAGRISSVRLWDTGSGYIEPPALSLVDPNNTSDAIFENRIGDGVLTNPSWTNRGLGYRTATTRVTITGNGFADRIPVGKFLDIGSLSVLPRPGSQLFFSGNPTRYTTITVEPTGNVNGELRARIRVSPELRVRDKLEHATGISIRDRYSQCRITGHDFLDVGTGNFEETNYPDLYNGGLFLTAPENEVIEEDGGRVFYTSTDQSGNFRTGELFAVEQATGIVTISADFFDLGGLTELRLGGIRVGGSGVVIREFSTDPLFTEDSNNVIPTQRAIARFLSNRLSLGGAEVAVGSIQAGQILLGGPDLISNALSLKIVIPVKADFTGPLSGISGSMLAQTMFFRSFYESEVN
jgi:hypothetical protein